MFFQKKKVYVSVISSKSQSTNHILNSSNASDDINIILSKSQSANQVQITDYADVTYVNKMTKLKIKTKIRYILRTLVGKLISILIIVGILVAKWVTRRILGVEMIIIGIHFTKKKIETSKEKLIERIKIILR